MYEIPIFPLNTVLFPGMPLSLHIFEERYKLMIQRCIKDGRPFGVVLIKEGVEAFGPLALPYNAGTSAQITQVEQLAEGRMNLGAIGRERFRVVSLNNEQPYLIAQAEPFPLGGERSPATIDAARRLRPWVIRYLEQLSRLESLDLDAEVVPDDPSTLAYMAAYLLQVPAEVKQTILEIEQAVDMLTQLRPIYRREVAFIKAMLARGDIQDVTGQGTFSLN